jgi:hypothetical protein
MQGIGKAREIDDLKTGDCTEHPIRKQGESCIRRTNIGEQRYRSWACNHRNSSEHLIRRN